MKAQTLILMLIVVALMVSAPVFAASHYNDTITARDFDGVVEYHYSVTFSDSASGAIYYTQAFWIGDMWGQPLLLNGICSEAGTEDVNVFVEYSNTQTGTFVTGTTNSTFDALGTTAVQDTMNVIAGTTDIKSLTYGWARLKFVAGQAINSTTVTGCLRIPKQAGLIGETVKKAGDTQ